MSQHRKENILWLDYFSRLGDLQIFSWSRHWDRLWRNVYVDPGLGGRCSDAVKGGALVPPGVLGRGPVHREQGPAEVIVLDRHI